MFGGGCTNYCLKMNRISSGKIILAHCRVDHCTPLKSNDLCLSNNFRFCLFKLHVHARTLHCNISIYNKMSVLTFFQHVRWCWCFMCISYILGWGQNLVYGVDVCTVLLFISPRDAVKHIKYNPVRGGGTCQHILADEWVWLLERRTQVLYFQKGLIK